MQGKGNLAIGVLVITAVVLFVGVMLSTQARPAYAIGQIDRGGDYIMVTGQYTDSLELVYLLDAAAQKLNAYCWDATREQFVLWQSLDFRRL